MRYGIEIKDFNPVRCALGAGHCPFECGNFQFPLSALRFKCAMGCICCRTIMFYKVGV
jgi:hypothetical protein